MTLGKARGLRQEGSPGTRDTAAQRPSHCPPLLAQHPQVPGDSATLLLGNWGIGTSEYRSVGFNGLHKEGRRAWAVWLERWFCGGRETVVTARGSGWVSGMTPRPGTLQAVTPPSPSSLPQHTSPTPTLTLPTRADPHGLLLLLWTSPVSGSCRVARNTR